MQNAGITRQIDGLGRIVVPIEMRKALGIKTKDDLDIVLEKNSIVIRKKITGCVVCDKNDNLSEIKNNRFMCIDCLTDIHG